MCTLLYAAQLAGAAKYTDCVSAERYCRCTLQQLVYWLSSLKMDPAPRVQIADKIDFISHSTNTLGKGMNLIIHPLALDK